MKNFGGAFLGGERGRRGKKKHAFLGTSANAEHE